jgi:hypothetical protein
VEEIGHEKRFEGFWLEGWEKRAQKYLENNKKNKRDEGASG